MATKTLFQPPNLKDNIAKELEEFKIESFLDLTEVEDYLGELPGIEDIKAFITNLLDKLSELKEFIEDFINGILDILNTVVKSIKELVDKIIGFISNILSGFGLTLAVRQSLLGSLLENCFPTNINSNNFPVSLQNLLLSSLVLTIVCKDINNTPFSSIYKAYKDADEIITLKNEISTLVSQVVPTTTRTLELTEDIQTIKTNLEIHTATLPTTDPAKQSLDTLNTLRDKQDTLQQQYQDILVGISIGDLPTIEKQIQEVSLQVKTQELDFQSKLETSTDTTIQSYLTDIKTKQTELTTLSRQLIPDTQLSKLLEIKQSELSDKLLAIDTQFKSIAKTIVNSTKDLSTDKIITLANDISSTTIGNNLIEYDPNITTTLINSYLKQLPKTTLGNSTPLPTDPLTGSRFNFEFTTVESSNVTLPDIKPLLPFLIIMDPLLGTVMSNNEVVNYLPHELPYPLVDEVNQICNSTAFRYQTTYLPKALSKVVQNNLTFTGNTTINNVSPSLLILRGEDYAV